MKEREIPEGASDTVICPICKKFMTWKLSNITGKYAWHCRNLGCSEYNPEQVDKEQATEFKPAPAMIGKNCIQVNVLGGVVQEITGIPKDQKVVVIDWDTEGVDKNQLVQLDEGEAIIQTWRGESTIPDQPIDLSELEEYMISRDSLECYIRLKKGVKLSKTITKPDAESKKIVVLNEIDRTEDEFKSLDDMAANHPGIHEALTFKEFFVYGYELGGY